MIFNKFFKKKDSGTGPDLNRSVFDLEKGYVFEYDMRTWEVKESYEYDWGGERFSKEYKISDGSQSLYLSVETDDELELTLAEKVKVRKVQQDLPQLIKDGKLPDSINFREKVYFLEEESPGYFKELNEPDTEWEEFIAWDYYTMDEKHILTLERWGEHSFDASFGKHIEEYEISNILPR
jgi:hypothetical protein